MKVVILAGGLGTRLSEETAARPKPMVEIGGKPIVWHIMKSYSQHGFRDFVLCLGYRGYMMKEWFANYFLHSSDVTINLKTNEVNVHSTHSEDWNITLVDTGETTQTGGRVKRVARYIDSRFMLTYGDGVGDIDLRRLAAFHEAHGKIATVTGVQPVGRFGRLDMKGDKVASFVEKPRGDAMWVNGGFFVMEPEVFDYIKGDATVLEKEPLENLARDGELMAYRHPGFWKSMDTIRDRKELEDLWASGKAPWKVWK